MTPNRFFPGPSGTGANVVVPMTDFSLAPVDGDRMTQEAIQKITERTAKTRSRLREHGFAQGNKIASYMRIMREDVTKEDIPVQLYEGPTLRDDFSFTHKLPQTPSTLINVPQTIEQLLDLYADRLMGGNASNVLRNLVHLSAADLGPAEYHMFSPQDRYLDEWLKEKLTGVIEKRFTRHELLGVEPRIGFALPYDDGTGKIQQFSFNKPQGSTIGPMDSVIEKLRGIDHVLVSEGLGVLLAKYNVDITQIFNPTSALHTESALEIYRRKEDSHWKDIPIVNDDEMEAWIKAMEEKQFEMLPNKIADAKFPMPFRKEDPKKIDEDAVNILKESHRRYRTLGEAQETDYVSIVMGVGCGPKGGQNQFKCREKYYIAAASTLAPEGAKELIELCGTREERGVQPEIVDVVGAGDAAFTATLMSRHYAPLENIVRQRHPELSDDRTRIAVMAFTTILQRVFGELVYHSKGRDLSGVPPQAFPVIFDKVLDKSIAAGRQLTTIDKVPSNVYRDDEWGVSFMTMELDR